MEHLLLSPNLFEKKWSLTILSLEEILNEISHLPLRDILTFLVANGVKDFSEKGFHKVKKIIKDKMNEAKYAFVPNKNEANLLLNFVQDPGYIDIHMLVPNYRYIDILRTGLLIKYYHVNHSEENQNRVLEIKKQIRRRPNGKQLSKLVVLPATPFFSAILRVIHEHKIEGYSTKLLEEEFDTFVDEYEKNSLLVETEKHSVDYVYKFCINQIKEQTDLFLILGMKSASGIVKNALKKLNKKKIFESEMYTHKLYNELIGNTPRTELRIFRVEM